MSALLLGCGCDFFKNRIFVASKLFGVGFLRSKITAKPNGNKGGLKKVIQINVKFAFAAAFARNAENPEPKMIENNTKAASEGPKIAKSLQNSAKTIKFVEPRH